MITVVELVLTLNVKPLTVELSATSAPTALTKPIRVTPVAGLTVVQVAALAIVVGGLVV